MKRIVAEQAWDDHLHWQATDKTLLKRINRLIEETRRSPFSGTGKPQSCLKVNSGAVLGELNAAQPQHPFDVVGQCAQTPSY